MSLIVSPVATRSGDHFGDLSRDRVIDLVAEWRVRAEKFTNPVYANMWRQAARELAAACRLSALEIKP